MYMYALSSYDGVKSCSGINYDSRKVPSVAELFSQLMMAENVACSVANPDKNIVIKSAKILCSNLAMLSKQVTSLISLIARHGQATLTNNQSGHLITHGVEVYY
jgi:hypothetical protein